MRWGAPLEGSLSEDYLLQADGSLRVTSSVAVAGRSASAALVYTRSGLTRQQLLDDSRRRNNSLQDVLRRQGEAA